MEYLKGNIIILVIVLLLFLLLRYIYIYTCNKQFQRDKVSKLMRSISMNSIYIVFAISLIMSLGLYNIAVLKADNNTKQEEINMMIEAMSSGYDNMVFSNEILEKVYKEYNTFFAGHYLEDGQNYVICITEESPQSLIDLLEENSIDYKQVKYNYSEIYNLYKVILSNPKFREFRGAGVNYQNNNVIIYVPTGYILPSDLIGYLEIGIVSVVETDLIMTH